VKPKHIQILGIVLSTMFAIFIAFLYATEPRSLGELTTKAGTAVGDALTKGQVITGTYAVDPAKFAQGLALFRAGDYPGARSAFEAADPEKRDGRTQFYIAYSLYRQGWGRFASDNKLFEQGLEVATRADKLLGGTYISDDQDLKLKTPAALRNELEEGLRVTADDFNPMRALEERK
jgi:Flp pilus assembly protein TadD